MSTIPRFKIQKGCTVTIPFTVKMNGEVTNITYYTLIMTCKKDLNDEDADAIFQKQDVKVNAPAGMTKFTFTENETKGYPEGVYPCDIKLFGNDEQLAVDVFELEIKKQATARTTL